MKTHKVIRRALKYLGVVNGNDPVAGEDFADALAEANLMLSHLAGSAGLTLDFTMPIVTGNEEFPFPAAHHGGLAAMLAVRLSGEYGGNLPITTVSIATQAENALVDAYHQIPTSSSNYTLTRHHQTGGTQGITDA